MYNTNLNCGVLGDIMASSKLLNISTKIVWRIEQNLASSASICKDGGYFLPCNSCATIALLRRCSLYKPDWTSITVRVEWEVSTWVFSRKIFISNTALNHNPFVWHCITPWARRILNRFRIAISGCGDLIVWQCQTFSFSGPNPPTLPRVRDSGSAPPMWESPGR